MEDILLTNKKTYLTYAQYAGDYQNMSIDDLLNKYCEAKDYDFDRDKNVYISALMLRFWNKINKLYEENKNLHLARIDYHNWLYDAIELACKYRGWQKKDRNVNGKQAIEQCINTIRVRYYYQINLEKNKMNQILKNSHSFGDLVINDEDSKMTYFDTIADSKQDVQNAVNLHSLFTKCIKTNKIIESIILDCLKTNDCSKIVKIKNKTTSGKAETTYRSELWRHKVIEILNDLPKDYGTYFSNEYDVKPEIIESALMTLKHANNNKKYKYLDSTLVVLRRFKGER